MVECYTPEKETVICCVWKRDKVKGRRWRGWWRTSYGERNSLHVRVVMVERSKKMTGVRVVRANKTFRPLALRADQDMTGVDGLGWVTELSPTP